MLEDLSPVQMPSTGASSHNEGWRELVLLPELVSLCPETRMTRKILSMSCCQWPFSESLSMHKLSSLHCLCLWLLGLFFPQTQIKHLILAVYTRETNSTITLLFRSLHNGFPTPHYFCRK